MPCKLPTGEAAAAARNVGRAAPCSETDAPTHLTPPPFPHGLGLLRAPLSSHSAGRLFHEVMTYDWTSEDDTEGSGASLQKVQVQRPHLSAEGGGTRGPGAKKTR